MSRLPESPPAAMAVVRIWCRNKPVPAGPYPTATVAFTAITIPTLTCVVGKYDRLEALQGRDRVRGKKPAVERSRLQDEIAGLAGVDVGEDVVVAECPSENILNRLNRL
jgi:hypothetical protein